MRPMKFKLLVLLSLLVLTIHSSALAKPKAVAKPPFPGAFKPNDSFNTTLDGKPLVCAKAKAAGNFIGGRLLKKGWFYPTAKELSAIKKTLRTAPSRQQPKIKKKVKALTTLKRDGDALCLSGPNGGGGGGGGGGSPTATPIPITDDTSLDTLARPITEDDIRYLLNKAAYGLSSNDQNVLDAGLSGGITAAVSAMMSIRPEIGGLGGRVVEWEDNNPSVPNEPDNISLVGLRRARLLEATHTLNPYRVKFTHFLLSTWTVGGSVLSGANGNPSQIPLWKDYWNLLRATADNPDLPNALVEVGRTPLMLIYLTGQDNLKDSPNENYARELMELFSLGPKRYDATTGAYVDNYVEIRGNDDRTQGDINRIAYRLTGNTVVLINGTWRSVFSQSDHAQGSQIIFEGNPWEFAAENDEDVVRGIFAGHPGAAQYFAREILKYYLTPEPPTLLVDNFAALIKANNFNLEVPMATLFASKAFHSDKYRHTLAKDPFELTVDFIRLMELNHVVGVDPNADYGYCIDCRDNEVVRMGMDVTNPPSVFWYPYESRSASPTLLQAANILFNIARDDNSQNTAQWTPQNVLPEGEVTSTAVIQHVAHRMGVTLNQNQIDQLKYYMDNRNFNNAGSITYYRQLYDNLKLQDQKDKGRTLYAMLAMLPGYTLK